MPEIITEAENTWEINFMLWLFFFWNEDTAWYGVWVSQSEGWHDLRPNRHFLPYWSFILFFHKDPKVYSRRAEMEPVEKGYGKLFSCPHISRALGSTRPGFESWLLQLQSELSPIRRGLWASVLLSIKWHSNNCFSHTAPIPKFPVAIRYKQGDTYILCMPVHRKPCACRRY